MAQIHESIKIVFAFLYDDFMDEQVIAESMRLKAQAGIDLDQSLTWLNITNEKRGLLINLNVVLLKNGIHRIVNNL